MLITHLSTTGPLVEDRREPKHPVTGLEGLATAATEFLYTGLSGDWDKWRLKERQVSDLP